MLCKKKLKGISVLIRSLLSSFQGAVRDKLKHITVLNIFNLPHIYRSGSSIPPGSTACTYHYWIASQLQRVDPRTSVSLLAVSRREIAERLTCECPLKTCPAFCSLFCFSFCHREFFKSQKEVALAFSKPSASQPLILQEKLHIKYSLARTSWVEVPSSGSPLNYYTLPKTIPVKDQLLLLQWKLCWRLQV